MSEDKMQETGKDFAIETVLSIGILCSRDHVKESITRFIGEHLNTASSLVPGILGQSKDIIERVFKGT